MTRINRHVWPGGVGVRCSVCGSVRRDDSEAGTPLGCIDRLITDIGTERSPVRACEDSEVIMARLAQLKAERDATLTMPAPEASAGDRPIIDYRDCCVG